MKKTLLLVLSLTFVFLMAACGSSSSGDGDVTELTMGFVPSRDADKIADSVTPLEERLSEVLGVPVKAEVMTNYAGLIEGMRTGTIDIGFLAPLNFVQAEEHANVKLILKSERYGDVSYLAQYAVRADLEDVNSVEDLVANQGLRWAMSDTGSASAYLFPGSQLMGLGVEDLNEHFSIIPTGSHDASIISLITGDADFATTFDDARTVVEGDYPDVMDKVKIVGYTDPIPNDTISVKGTLSDEWVTKIKDAFLSFNDDEEMIQVMNEVYQWTGIREAKSEDYDVVRSTFEHFKEQLEQ